MDKKINIGLFIDTYYPMCDGVIQVVDNYARRLKEIANVTVFAPLVDKKYDDSLLPYKVVRCKSMDLMMFDYKAPIPNNDRKFKKAVKDANLDIIHIHSPFTVGDMALKFAKKHNIPTIITMHSQFKQDFFRATKSKALTKFLLSKIMNVFNGAGVAWAVNQNVAEVFKTYGYKREPIVMQNGTDLIAVENKVESNKKINEMFNLKEEDNVFLFVGRLTLVKNILFIVDVMKQLKNDGYNFKMLFVGSGQDEEMLRNKIASCDLQQNVILCGKIMDRQLLAEMYARAKLFVFPSLYDCSSLVQIEAASQSTPTIFIKGAVTAGTVTEDVNGFLAENDVSLFAKKIEQIVDDKEYYAKVSEGCKRDLYKTWDEIVKDVYEKYEKIILENKQQENKK